MITDDAGHQYYTAKDIEKYLGINAKTLYHWVQTRRLLKPSVQVHGRGRSNLFSLDDLATLSLIQALTNLGMELGAIDFLISRLTDPKPSNLEKWPFPPLPAPKDRSPDHLLYGMVFAGRNRRFVSVRANLWHMYKDKRKTLRRDGYNLFFAISSTAKIDQGAVSSFLADNKRIMQLIDWHKSEFNRLGLPEITSFHIIDLLAIIRNLEKVTEKTF
jgi:DNA-binding transcriptional MerR regulator